MILLFSLDRLGDATALPDGKDNLSSAPCCLVSQHWDKYGLVVREFKQRLRARTKLKPLPPARLHLQQQKTLYAIHDQIDQNAQTQVSSQKRRWHKPELKELDRSGSKKGI